MIRQHLMRGAYPPQPSPYVNIGTSNRLTALKQDRSVQAVQVRFPVAGEVTPTWFEPRSGSHREFMVVQALSSALVVGLFAFWAGFRAYTDLGLCAWGRGLVQGKGSGAGMPCAWAAG